MYQTNFGFSYVIFYTPMKGKKNHLTDSINSLPLEYSSIHTKHNNFLFFLISSDFYY